MEVGHKSYVSTGAMAKIKSVKSKTPVYEKLYRATLCLLTNVFKQWRNERKAR